MPFELIIAFGILLGALVIFILDIYPIDFVAFTIMGLVLVLGPILGVTPQEAISGFSNPATITILAMFVLSAGINRTGLINLLAQRMIRFAGKSEIRQLITVMVVVSPISAFINNTAAVALLIPSVITMAREHGRAPSKLLIPLSYFSQLAGALTLIGTATNILASSLSAREGFGGFGMFEFTQVGVLIFVTGALYLIFLSGRLLPERRLESEIAEDYRMGEYLTEIVILDNSPLIGKTLVDGHFREQFKIEVLEVLRDRQKLQHPLAEHILQAGDILFVQTGTKQLLKLKDVKGLAIEPELELPAEDLKMNQRKLLEVIIAPNSNLIGGTLKSTNFRHHYNCTVIAIRKHGSVLRERLSRVVLNFGDTLLLRGSSPVIDLMKVEPGFIVTEELEQTMYRQDKIPIALAIIIGVVGLAAFGQPILVTSIAGCILMVLTGCLKVNELHEAIRWDVIFLLSGIIPLGLALQRTGGADLLASVATLSANYVPPLVVLIVFYIMSVVIAEFISHSGAVVIMVPVGIATAQSLGLDPRAFVLASMFAASMSFSTPVGYQTNTMVYGPGGYKFLDYVKVGAPLSLLLAITTPIFIYLVWGL